MPGEVKSVGEVQTIEFETFQRYGLTFDENNKNYSPEPEYNMVFLKSMAAYLQQRLELKGFIFLNDVLENLGFPIYPEGQVLGWIRRDGYLAVDVRVETDDAGRLHLVIWLEPQGVIVNEIKHLL